MRVYLDSSVIVRVVLSEPNALSTWREIDFAVASAITRAECFRTIDRLRVLEILTGAEAESKRADVEKILTAVELLPVTDHVLRRVGEPLPILLRTLDAIHLVTALWFRSTDSAPEPLVFATHDNDLAGAARLHDFPVVGV
jgi:predicted nucleic acid-binding protein